MKPALRSVSTELPDPPYPGDVKANGWSPQFDISRIKTSETWVLAEDDERNFLLRIWFECWESVPVGSMPSNLDVFARRIGCKRQFLEAHKDIFLRGWELHSDGKLYHNFITTQILELLGKRRTTAKRVKAWREKNKEKQGEDEKSNALRTPCNMRTGRDGTGRDGKTSLESPTCVPSQTQSSEEISEVCSEKSSEKKQKPAAAEPSASTPARQTSPPSTDKSPAWIVFEFWQQAMGHPRAKFDGKRKRAIEGRLKDGFKIGDIQQAINGCKATPWNMGQNTNRKIYDDIELICRNAPNLERFMASSEEHKIESHGLNDWLADGNGKDDRIFEGEFQHVY